MSDKKKRTHRQASCNGVPFQIPPLQRTLLGGCIDSVECGTVEWNSGTVEWWNSGMVEWLDGRLTTLYCFAAVTVINTHAHFGATVASLFMLSVRGRYSYDRLLVPGNCKLQWQIGFLLKGF